MNRWLLVRRLNAFRWDVYRLQNSKGRGPLVLDIGRWQVMIGRRWHGR